MKKIGMEFPLGVLLGMASWLVVPLVSNRVEPYDSGIGLALGQAMMAAAALVFGFARGMKRVWIFLGGAYVGLNLYPMVFGSSELKAWAGLGLVMSIFLCVGPLLAGMAGKAVRLLHDRRKSREKRPL